MIVYLNNGKPVNIDEKKEITRGGEGIIIKFDKDTVVKIYLPGIQTITEKKFLSLNAIHSSEFIKPETLLYNKKGNVVGFTMKMVDLDHYPIFSIYNSSFCQRVGIDTDLKIKISEKIIQSVDYIHKQDIVIGDLNPFNILINDKGSIAFIDVDSYQTPGNPHSGRLLDDIRDYLYHGKITKESDYFALAVGIFNMLTNIHPFKGVHDVYKGLAERMIHKIPVFKQDKQLKIPKCYQPITDPYLMNQFERIFLNGERFILSIKPNVQINKTRIKAKQSIGNLMITDILINSNIKYVQATDKILCIHTKDKVYIYDVGYKGIYRALNEIPECETYLSDKGVFIRDDKNLNFIDYHSTNPITIKNFKFKNPLYIQQYGDILVVVNEDFSYYLYLNQILKNEIKFEVKNMYGPGFRKTNGLIQNIVGNSYGFYNHKGILNQIRFEEKINDIYQVGNVGCIQYVEKEKIKYKLFNVNGLRVETSYEVNNLKYIGYKDNMIFMSEDDNLVILRPSDFSEISKFQCSLIDEDTQIFNTTSGIIINNDTGVYLLNTK